MAIAHCRLVIGGTLAGSQGWSMGVSLAPDFPGMSPGQLDTFAQQAYADFLATAWNATSGTGGLPLKGIASSSATVTGARVYAYRAGSSASYGVGYSTGAAVAGTSSPTLPGQIALVASLIGEFGGRAPGRMYLPALAVSVGADLRTGVGVGLVAQTFANWLSLLRTRNVAGAPATPIVAFATGGYTEVTGVRVDNVLDTQRRRRDKITATSIGRATLSVG